MWNIIKENRHINNTVLFELQLQHHQNSLHQVIVQSSANHQGGVRKQVAQDTQRLLKQYKTHSADTYLLQLHSDISKQINTTTKDQSLTIIQKETLR